MSVDVWKKYEKAKLLNISEEEDYKKQRKWHNKMYNRKCNVFREEINRYKWILI